MSEEGRQRAGTWRAFELGGMLSLALAAMSCSQSDASVAPPAVVAGRVEQPLFLNGDFEDGPQNAVPTSWTLTTYLNHNVVRSTPQTRANLQLAGGGTAQTRTLYTPGAAESQSDAVLGSGASLRWPKFGHFAAYINMNPGASYNVNSLKQTMVLGVNDVDPYDGKPHIRFAVAPVLENPAHAPEAQPYYFVQVKNVTTNAVLYVDYNASAEPGIPWKTSNGYYYTDWQLKDIAPTSTQAALGDTIELEVIAAGCSAGGHFGRVYVDGVGSTVPGLGVSASAPASANSNTDITYDLVFGNGGSGAAGNVVVDFNTPPNTTFKSVAAPGAVCTQPSVGASGLVECTYGLLDAGTSNSLQVTVHIGSGVTGSITAGNYQISANNSTPLLGAKVYTTVTSGLTYTDIEVTNTNGVGAVNWGQPVAYSIVVTNHGPSAVSGGSLIAPMPNILTGVTWNCSGSAGASCNSGAGSIIDPDVELPVGGVVTYTVNATLAASGSATRLVTTATFTLPGGMTDSQPSDNAAADTDPITTTYTLDVSKGGNASGSVVSVPVAIQCGTACSSQTASFGQGTQLILSATPAPGKLFSGWSGGACSGTSNCSITLNSNTSVIASFDSPPSCADDSECSATRYCDGTSNTCATRLPNGTPIPNDGIHDGTCATMDLACVSLLCNANKCAKPAGGSCTSSAECASNNCVANVCDKLAIGAFCASNNDCASANCKSQHCVPAGTGCYLDVDCSGSQYCNQFSLTCTAKLSAGAAIPSDGLHGGTCSDAAAVCASAQCNAVTNSCALANGGSCTTGLQCVNNTCTSAHCVPSSSGCYVDGDCPPGDFCDHANLLCTGALGAGAALPNDGLHDGSCAAANRVCLTGLCNADASTCADNDNSGCSNPNQCVSNNCIGSHCVPAVDGCYSDVDCVGGYCDRSLLTCATRLAAGAALPTDGLHSGSCDDAGLVCQSGLCNPNSLSCGLPDGDGCSAAAQCVTDTCLSSHCVPASNGCYLDADCPGTSFCDRSTLTCATKLLSGAAVPNDGLHGGTCSNAGDVCDTGLCNTMTRTCADSSNALCTTANQCVSNSCLGGHCVPAVGGCFNDEDCPSDRFCNRTALTCRVKLQAGIAIPSDGLHTGSCDDAAFVCQNAGCDSVGETCARADGGTCSAANQCTSHTCISAHCVPAANGCYIDADCGADNTFCDHSSLTCASKLALGAALPNDGLHGGGCADASAVCASGLCNSVAVTCGAADAATCSVGQECVSDNCLSGHCVPASLGCYLDGDCAGGNYCDRSTLTCTSQLIDGTGIPSDGLHTGSCDDAVAVCQSGSCNSNSQTCAHDDGGSCNDPSECVSDTCTSGHCVPAANGCYIDADCGPASYCDRSNLRCRGRLINGIPIPNSDGYHGGGCAAAVALCESRRCNPTRQTCADDRGAPCDSSHDCTNDVCDSNGLCGLRDGAAGCDSGNGATLCQSGVCSASGRCVPSGGAGCYLDSDCASSEFCLRSSLTCQPKLNDGGAIVSDGLHDGRCTQQNALALCANAGCNNLTNTCASRNGTSCSAPNQCVRNICGSNGKCGYADNFGPCTASDAKFVCQSATCSTTGNVCVPPASRSCAGDVDCGTHEFCDPHNSICVPDLGNGQSIPSDSVHGGLCSAAVALTVCVSGSCNAVTQRCAARLTDSCSAASDCASNVCGSNGRCGLWSGQGPCTHADQSQSCQSGLCSASGVCLAPGSCSVDADCLPDKFCDRSHQVCATRLRSGSALPVDGYHDGSCPSSGLSTVCASGLCSTQPARCTSSNGASCNADQECASGTCGVNGQCGAEPGATGCSPGADPSCQSGVCAGDGTCAAAAACSSDADCAGDGAFCSDAGCLPRLPLGAAIPNDALHAGHCDPTIAQALCQSGLCNPDSATCGGAPASSCAVPAQCASNVCAANERCGLPNGLGPCTAISAAEVCQSGACSPNTAVCTNPGGCAGDIDCAPDKYCDGDMFVCAALLAAGAHIPSDGTHDASCTSANARVCASGLCNVSAHTCALANGADCAGPAECASGVCASDGKCGALNGQGLCTPAEPAVCRSAHCSATTLSCIPSGGCGGDNDCGAGSYCDTSTHLCAQRAGIGASLPANVESGDCPSSGISRACAAGVCNPITNTCAAPNGVACGHAADCQVNVCGGNALCGVEDGGACNPGASDLCQSGRCGDGGSCEAPADCLVDADCPLGYCDGIVCRPARRPGSTLPNDGLHDGRCSPALAGIACSSGQCNETTDTCAGPLASPCADAGFCVANACGRDGACGLNVGEGRCSDLDATAICRTGLCSAVGVCLPNQTSGCAVDSDCGSVGFCDLTQYACVPKLQDGAAIPNDGLHDGNCNDRVGAAVCASGACNPIVDTCARPNGTSCSAASTCIHNICGINHRCGIAEGDGSCTPQSADLCQSGRCSVSAHRCIRVGQGCAADDDCNNKSYCVPAALLCVTKRGAGVALPMDTLHSGSCSPALASAVCQTAACNPHSQTCAAQNGMSCANAAECASGRCGENGRCGLAIGQAGCSPDSSVEDCQSGYCAASGVCVPPDGCDLDADCSDDSYCNRTPHMCAPKLLAGAALPSDSLHEGECSSELASAVCASGACNPQTNTCAAKAASECTLPEQCVTNQCADDGHCGWPDGVGPCQQDADCQSGRCLREISKCVAAEGGCGADRDCAGDAYCDLSQWHCAADLADDAQLPAGGKCSAEVARSVCKSGACNPINDRCARLGGSACKSAAECAADVCSAGKCASPDGSGACTAANAASACQSGRCHGELGRCIAAEDGCSKDADCSAGSYCDAPTLACVERLASGEPLPSDDMHDANCSDDVALAVCSTRACNTRTDRCAAMPGQSCNAAEDCASDVCPKSLCAAAGEASAGKNSGGCSAVALKADRIGPSLALLWVVALGLRLRTRRKPGTRTH